MQACLVGACVRAHAACGMTFGLFWCCRVTLNAAAAADVRHHTPAVSGLERAPDNDALKQGAEEARKARTPQATPARAADRDPAAAAGAGGGEGEGGKTQEDLDLEALLGIAEEVEQKKYMRPKEESQQPVVELGTQQEQIGACGRLVNITVQWSPCRNASHNVGRGCYAQAQTVFCNATTSGST